MERNESASIRAAVEQERRFNDLEASVKAINVAIEANQREMRQKLDELRKENDAAHHTVLAEVKRLGADVAKALTWMVEHHNLHEEMPDLEEMEGNVTVLMKERHDSGVVKGVWKTQARWFFAGVTLASSMSYAILRILG